MIIYQLNTICRSIQLILNAVIDRKRINLDKALELNQELIEILKVNKKAIGLRTLIMPLCEHISDGSASNQSRCIACKQLFERKL